MKRLHPTLADYTVIAISPVLIMALVGSLVFFLVEIFHQGEFEGRLRVILALFVMAAVLIGRISIEEGREYASLFAIPLGIVTVIALFRFVQFQGPLAPFSPIINIALLAIIWWSADRLTWDCTVIDGPQDVTNEGLLQTVGLDGTSGADQEERALERDLDATTSRTAEPLNLWSRFVESRRRPHPHGVWVVYFSLAAVPIFGLGQRFVSAGDLASRRYVFHLLVVYIAAALGLLLTTSFLGLRQYLRRRRLEMPREMAAVWLTVGGTVIAAVLLVSMFLPRRNAEYSVTQLPILARPRDDLRPSRFGVGNDGLEQKEEPSSGGPKGEPTSDGQQSPTSPKGGQRAASDQDSSQDASQRSGGGAKSSQDSDRSEPSSPNQDDEPSPQPSSGGKQQSQRSGNRAGQDSTKPATRADDEGTDQDNRSSDRAEQSSTKPAQHNEDRANDGGQARDGQKPAGDRGGSRQDDSASGERPGEKGPPGSDRGKKDKSGESSSEGPARKVDSQDKAKRSEPDEREGTKNRARPQSRPASQTSWNASELLQRLWPGVGQLLKWIYWLALFLIVAYFVWRHGTQFVAALRNFVRSLQELWRRLFGGGEDSPVEEGAGEAAGPPAPRFSDFSDPFLTGQADQWTADEVVRYSFQALEAWARERGCERLPEQTPYEFARLLAARQRTLESEVLRMAELYNISAYGAANATTTSVRPLRRFWELLRTTPVTAS